MTVTSLSSGEYHQPLSPRVSLLSKESVIIRSFHKNICTMQWLIGYRTSTSTFLITWNELGGYFPMYTTSFIAMANNNTFIGTFMMFYIRMRTSLFESSFRHTKIKKNWVFLSKGRFQIDAIISQSCQMAINQFGSTNAFQTAHFSHIRKLIIPLLKCLLDWIAHVKCVNLVHILSLCFSFSSTGMFNSIWRFVYM